MRWPSPVGIRKGVLSLKRRLVCLLLAALLLLGACARTEIRESGGEGYDVWFAAVDALGGPAVAREERKLPEGSQPVEGLLAALLSGPRSEELASPFPDGVRVRSTRLSEDRVLTVDLSERYGGLSGVELTVADYCIAMTLCQLESVDAVTVTVEGEAIPFRSRQLLRPGDVLLSGAEGEPVTLSVDLYYPGPEGLLVVEERDVLITENGTRAAAVLAALLAGPESQDHYLPLPEGTELLNAAIEGDICYADFSAPFLADAPADPVQARLLLYAVVNTLCALDGVEAVHLLVEGESVESYGGIPTNAPLEKNGVLAGEGGQDQGKEP